MDWIKDDLSIILVSSISYWTAHFLIETSSVKQTLYWKFNGNCTQKITFSMEIVLDFTKWFFMCMLHHFISSHCSIFPIRHMAFNVKFVYVFLLFVFFFYSNESKMRLLRINRMSLRNAFSLHMLGIALKTQI